MTTSILIVAHNEESHIKNCIESVLRQTLTPDEVVVICHNCTDKTLLIAQSFTAIKVIKYDGPEGVPYARIKGFQEVSGDIIACLDGDSIVDQKWLYTITKPLEHAQIALVAGYVVLTNTLYSRLSSFFQFVILRKVLRLKQNYFAWGASFACRKIDYEKVRGIAPILDLKQKLTLHFWAEDLYLSLALMQIGEMYCAINAKSYTMLPQWKLNIATAPLRKWKEDNQALFHYFNNKK